MAGLNSTVLDPLQIEKNATHLPETGTVPFTRSKDQSEEQRIYTVRGKWNQAKYLTNIKVLFENYNNNFFAGVITSFLIVTTFTTFIFGTDNPIRMYGLISPK